MGTGITTVHTYGNTAVIHLQGTQCEVGIDGTVGLDELAVRDASIEPQRLPVLLGAFQGIDLCMLEARNLHRRIDRQTEIAAPQVDLEGSSMECSVVGGPARQ